MTCPRPASFLHVSSLQVLALAWVALATLAGCTADTFAGPGPDLDASGDALITPDPDGGDEAPALDGAPDGAPADGAIPDAPSTIDAPLPPSSYRVFVTSAHYQGDLGGVAGADQKCQAAATAASLGGTWAAWLSTYSSPASARLFHSTVPYKLVDGTVVAADWAGLTSGALLHEIDRDEHGTLIPGPCGNAGMFWTETQIDGSYAPGTLDLDVDCHQFTSNDPDGGSFPTGYVGCTSRSDQTWTVAYGIVCRTALSLLCVEQ